MNTSLAIPAEPKRAGSAELETMKDLSSAIAEWLSKHLHRTQEQVRTRRCELVRTANLICKCLKSSPDRTLISEIVEIDSKLSAYMSRLGCPPGTQRNHICRKKVLLRCAKQLGWSPETFALEDEWAPILAAVKGSLDCPAIVKYAMRLKRRPAEFSQEDLDSWAQDRIDHGKGDTFAVKAQARFRRCMRAAGLQDSFPQLDLESRKPSTYRLSISKMPPALQSDIERILNWARSKASGSSGDAIRFVSADDLQQEIERLCGYAINILHLEMPSSLKQVITEECLGQFAEWLCDEDERDCLRTSLKARLGGIRTLVFHHPDFETDDYCWIQDILDEYEIEDEKELKVRRRSREIDYDTLAMVPVKIREEEPEDDSSNPIAVAWARHDELLMEWLVSLPWPPQNIRACRIRKRPNNNVRVKPIIKISATWKLPPWVMEYQPKKNSARFWPFHFSKTETAAGKEIHGFIPRTLVPLLEDYLHHHRSKMIPDRSKDPGTVFLNRKGEPLTVHGLIELVGQLSLRHTGKRVTPTACRAIFAYKWLEDHPGDYENLSQILWMDIPSAIRRYGNDKQKSGLSRGSGHHEKRTRR